MEPFGGKKMETQSSKGVDGQTAAKYAADLELNLQSLLDRAKTGDHYHAPPVRRLYIPKGDGKKTRPIGIPAFEDKVLQRAVAMVLEAVYEQDFLDCSYGFRPGRSAHQALQAKSDNRCHLLKHAFMPRPARDAATRANLLRDETECNLAGYAPRIHRR